MHPSHTRLPSEVGAILASVWLSTLAQIGCGDGPPEEFDDAVEQQPCLPASAADACVGRAPSSLHLLPMGLGVVTSTAEIAIVSWNSDGVASAFVGPTGYGSVNPDDTLIGCRIDGASASVYLGSRQAATMTRIWDFTDAGEWMGGPDLATAVLAPRCGDLDGDGLDELVGLWTPDGEARAYRGSERFGSRWTLAADLSEAGNPPFSSLVVDLDGDSEREYVFASVTEPTVHVLRGLREGDVPVVSRWPAGAPIMGALAAKAGSARLVWVGSGEDGNALLGAFALSEDALEPESDLTFETLAAPNRLFLADLDADGIEDAVVASMPGSEYAVHLGLPGGTFAPFATRPMPATAIDMAIADLDGDGQLDLACLPAGTDVLTVAWGDGTGAFVPGA